MQTIFSAAQRSKEEERAERRRKQEDYRRCLDEQLAELRQRRERERNYRQASDDCISKVDFGIPIPLKFAGTNRMYICTLNPQTDFPLSDSSLHENFCTIKFKAQKRHPIFVIFLKQRLDLRRLQSPVITGAQRRREQPRPPFQDHFHLSQTV